MEKGSERLNLFLNFIKPNAGEMIIDGINCTDEPLKAKSKLAYVSENVMLYSNFTAMQNLDFFARLAGHSHYTKDDFRRLWNRIDRSNDGKKGNDIRHKKNRQNKAIAISMYQHGDFKTKKEAAEHINTKLPHITVDLACIYLRNIFFYYRPRDHREVF